MTGPSIPADLADLLSQTWPPHAACRDENPGLFDSDTKVLVDLAKRVCARCTVQPQCLTWAVDHGEEGTWGGLSQREREDRPGAGRPPQPCGTTAAARRHLRRGEFVDAACAEVWEQRLAAERDRGRQRRAERHAGAGGLAS